MNEQAAMPPALGPDGAAEWPQLGHAAALGISFRAVRQQDRPFLVDLYRSTREGELDRTPWVEAQKQAFIAMQFDAQHRHYQEHYPAALWLVVLQRGAAIGRLYLERWSKEHRIIDIALLPQLRGSGIGGALLRDLMAEAASAKKSVSIHVEKENPAMTLYRRLGFCKQEDKGVYDLLSWSGA